MYSVLFSPPHRMAATLYFVPRTLKLLLTTSVSTQLLLVLENCLSIADDASFKRKPRQFSSGRSYYSIHPFDALSQVASSSFTLSSKRSFLVHLDRENADTPTITISSILPLNIEYSRHLWPSAELTS